MSGLRVFVLYLLFLFRLQCGCYESLEQRMWAVWSGFEFRVSLCGNEERVIREFDDLHNSSIRRQSGEGHAMIYESGTVIVIYLITMPVTFVDQFFAVQLIGLGVFIKNTWAGAET